MFRWRECDLSHVPMAPGCYAIYHDGELVYIGSSQRLAERLDTHPHRVIGDVAVRIKIALSRRKGEGLMREFRLIQRLRPSLNRQYCERPKQRLTATHNSGYRHAHENDRPNRATSGAREAGRDTKTSGTTTRSVAAIFMRPAGRPQNRIERDAGEIRTPIRCSLKPSTLARRDAMMQLRATGATYEAIASQFGVTKQYIQLLLSLIPLAEFNAAIARAEAKS